MLMEVSNKFGCSNVLAILSVNKKLSILVAFGKMFWSSEDRVRARFHYAESRQNKPQVNLWRKSF